MNKLKQILDNNSNVRESDIPKEWLESFNSFMFGQTCMAECNEDGSIKEFLYYPWDVKRWYNLNKVAIERDIQIDKIIGNEKNNN